MTQSTSKTKTADDKSPNGDGESMLRCPKCRTPFAGGTLGDGSRLAVKCRRCKETFYVAVV